METKSKKYNHQLAQKGPPHHGKKIMAWVFFNRITQENLKG